MERKLRTATTNNEEPIIMLIYFCVLGFKFTFSIVEPKANQATCKGIQIKFIMINLYFFKDIYLNLSGETLSDAITLIFVRKDANKAFQ